MRQMRIQGGLIEIFYFMVIYVCVDTPIFLLTRSASDCELDICGLKIQLLNFL